MEIWTHNLQYTSVQRTEEDLNESQFLTNLFSFLNLFRDKSRHSCVTAPSHSQASTHTGSRVATAEVMVSSSQCTAQTAESPVSPTGLGAALPEATKVGAAFTLGLFRNANWTLNIHCLCYIDIHYIDVLTVFYWYTISSECLLTDRDFSSALSPLEKI